MLKGNNEQLASSAPHPHRPESLLPGTEAAFHIVHLPEASILHQHANAHGAPFGAAVDKVGILRVQLFQAVPEVRGEVADIDGAGEVSLLKLFRGAHVEQDGARLLIQGTGEFNGLKVIQLPFEYLPAAGNAGIIVHTANFS